MGEQERDDRAQERVFSNVNHFNYFNSNLLPEYVLRGNKS